VGLSSCRLAGYGDDKEDSMGGTFLDLQAEDVKVMMMTEGDKKNPGDCIGAFAFRRNQSMEYRSYTLNGEPM
jgi:hypothetical protein